MDSHREEESIFKVKKAEILQNLGCGLQLKRPIMGGKSKPRQRVNNNLFSHVKGERQKSAFPYPLPPIERERQIS